MKALSQTSPDRHGQLQLCPGGRTRSMPIALRPAVLDRCDACATGGTGPCRRCVGRGRSLLADVERGVSVSDAARSAGLTRRFAAELVAEARDRRALAETSVPPVPNIRLREHYERLHRMNPDYGPKLLASAGGWRSAVDPERLLGLCATSDRTIGDVTYPGGVTTHITSAAAGRLAIAMGLAPIDVD